MRSHGIAILVASLLAAGAAAAQTNLAAAVPAPKGDLVVFTDKGHALSPTALATIREAAREAVGGRQVTLIGRPENVAAVKSELVRQGLAGQAIVVRAETRPPIAKVVDGLDPIDRRVEIKF